MNGAGRHIVITGAGGFIGSCLAQRLLADPAFDDARITLADIAIQAPPVDLRMRTVIGDLTNRAVLEEMIDGRADIVFHLAGVLGGAAEANYALSRRVNLDATLDLLEMLRDPGSPPRVVFASSIAVFGPPLPDMIDDDTIPVPTMNYGAHKRMIEIAVEQFSARGWIDGLAVRLPGIVARTGADGRLKSSFLNTMFYDFRDGRDINLPVGPDATTWLISVPTCVEALLHAAQVPSESLAQRRAFTLPAQRTTILALVENLRQRFPASATVVSYSPDAELESQFARQPPLETAIADRLGFRHDGSLSALVERAMNHAGLSM